MQLTIFYILFPLAKKNHIMSVKIGNHNLDFNILYIDHTI
jgi:hypothetical protein